MWLCMVLPHATEAPVCEMNKLLNCQYVLFLQTSIIQSTKHQTSQWQNKLFGIGREDLANFSWAQPTYSALFLIPQMHVPYKWAPFERELSNGIRFIAKKHCYHREIIYQTQISLLFVLVYFSTDLICEVEVKCNDLLFRNLNLVLRSAIKVVDVLKTISNSRNVIVHIFN